MLLKSARSSEAKFGKGNAAAIGDAGYFEDLVAAWSMAAIEHQLHDLKGLRVVH